MPTATSEQVALMKRACLLCDKSLCGYKTGCVAVVGDRVIEGWNETLPGEVYCQNGECTRKKLGLRGGQDIHKVCSIHAEASVVAQAARDGISLKGADIYVTTFPCIICARLLTKTEVARVFYMSDYAGTNEGLGLLIGAGITVLQIPEREVWQN